LFGSFLRTFTREFFKKNRFQEEVKPVSDIDGFGIPFPPRVGERKAHEKVTLKEPFDFKLGRLAFCFIGKIQCQMNF